MAATLAWMLAMSQRKIHACPSLLGFITSSRLAASCRIVVVVAQPFSDVMSYSERCIALRLVYGAGPR